MFRSRSTRLERIDTGDYTTEEYSRFLREIAFINKYLGDRRALKKTLFREIDKNGETSFSVLDVGSGSGQLLRATSVFARNTRRKAFLAGIDLSELSSAGARDASIAYPEISLICGDAFQLPFADASFDYVISSLFFHHLTNEQIPLVLSEMSRVAARAIFVIDLHRHPAAYVSYKIFCTAFGISRLVREDGSLSIKKGFSPPELSCYQHFSPDFACRTKRCFPFRLILSCSKNG